MKKSKSAGHQEEVQGARTKKTKSLPKLPIVAIIGLLVKWSGIAMTDGRGKVGGSVVSKSRAGATVRNKVTPSNPRTAAQSFIRSLFTSFVQNFRNLTSSQINAWNAAANNGFTTTNIFGDTVKKSGINLYAQLNVNLSIVGAAAIDDAPSNPEPPAPIYRVDYQADVSSTQLFLNLDFSGTGDTIVPDGSSIAVYATPKLSNGVRFVRSQLRLLGVIEATEDTATFNLWSTYAAKYGALAVGDNVVLAVQAISAVSGQSGTPLQDVVTIQA